MVASGRLNVIRADELRVDTTQTLGMLRRQIAPLEGAWVGVVTTEPGVTAGWHHHGDYETIIYVLEGTIRLEFGAGGSETCEAGPSDSVYVPRGAVHREGNPGRAQQRLLVIRAGRGEPVFNVAEPAT